MMATPTREEQIRWHREQIADGEAWLEDEADATHPEIVRERGIVSAMLDDYRAKLRALLAEATEGGERNDDGTRARAEGPDATARGGDMAKQRTNRSENSRFRKGSGVYQCSDCGRHTRETGEGESGCGLCVDCYEAAGLENSHADGMHRDVPHPGCRACADAIAATAAGGPLAGDSALRMERHVLGAVRALNEGMDEMIGATGGETGRGFNEAEREVWEALVAARRRLDAVRVQVEDAAAAARQK